jgi:hypothetical protein
MTVVRGKKGWKLLPPFLLFIFPSHVLVAYDDLPVYGPLAFALFLRSLRLPAF